MGNIFIKKCFYLKIPRHSVSSVLVLHILAVPFSLPVTIKDLSSDNAMQLMPPSSFLMVSFSLSLVSLLPEEPISDRSATAVLRILQLWIATARTEKNVKFTPYVHGLILEPICIVSVELTES